MATPHTGRTCSSCLRNTQSWNCPVRDYRFWQGKEGQEVIRGTPTHRPLPADVSPLPGTLSSDSSKKSFVCRPGAAGRPMSSKGPCMHLLHPALSFLFNQIWGQNGLSLLFRTHPQNKMTKSKRNEIRKTRRQFMEFTHAEKHKGLSP